MKQENGKTFVAIKRKDEPILTAFVDMEEIQEFWQKQMEKSGGRRLFIEEMKYPPEYFASMAALKLPFPDAGVENED